MAKRKGGPRRKARSKLSKHTREKGKVRITGYLRQFDVGDKIMLTCNPTVAEGTYHMRFHNKNGIIAGKQGECYIVKINDINKEKELIVHPVHIKKLAE